MTEFVAKVQLPQFSTGEPQALLYNFDRSQRLFLPVTPELRRVLGDAAKSFWRVRVTESGVDFIEKVPDRDW